MIRVYVHFYGKIQSPCYSSDPDQVQDLDQDKGHIQGFCYNHVDTKVTIDCRVKKKK